MYAIKYVCYKIWYITRLSFNIICSCGCTNMSPAHPAFSGRLGRTEIYYQ